MKKKHRSTIVQSKKTKCQRLVHMLTVKEAFCGEPNREQRRRRMEETEAEGKPRQKRPTGGNKNENLNTFETKHLQKNTQRTGEDEQKHKACIEDVQYF